MSDDLIAWLRGVLDDEWPPVVLRVEDERTRADIAAKRAVLDRAEDAARLEGSKPGYDAVARLNVSLAKVLAPELERVVRLLASAYAERPGYREEWGPDSSVASA